MLRYRLIFGPLMIAGLLLLLYLDERLTGFDLSGTGYAAVAQRPDIPAGTMILLLFLALIVLASRELCAIFRAERVDADPFMVTLSAAIGCVLIYALPMSLEPVPALAIYASFMVGIFLLTIVKYAWRAQRTDGAVTVAAVTMLAMVYIGLLPGFYLAIRRDHSVWLIAAIILVTKSCDIGAYFTGRALGRRKLIAWLSPGKTWEGLAGGVIFSGLVAGTIGTIACAAGATAVPPAYVAGCGVLIGAFGQFGDLVASLFKRDAGIKDSGSTIPGFGGVLDVIDSPIVVAPLAYWLVRLGEQLVSP